MPLLVSILGDDAKYTQGTVANAELVANGLAFAYWRVRVYHDDSALQPKSVHFFMPPLFSKGSTFKKKEVPKSSTDVPSR